MQSNRFDRSGQFLLKDILIYTLQIHVVSTAWKVSVFGVFLIRISRIRSETERYSVALYIQSECGKIHARKLQIQTRSVATLKEIVISHKTGKNTGASQENHRFLLNSDVNQFIFNSSSNEFEERADYSGKFFWTFDFFFSKQPAMLLTQRHLSLVIWIWLMNFLKSFQL